MGKHELSQPALLNLYDEEMRLGMSYPDMRKDILPWGVRFVRPAPGMSFIAYHRLDENSADAAIQEQLEYFQGINQPFQWAVFDHDRPADMKNRLVAHGFEPDEPGALMVLDLSAAPAVLLEPSEIDIRQVTHRTGLGEVIQVLEQVWGSNFDWIWERMGRHLEIQGYLNLYVAYVEDQPTSVGWVYFHHGSQFASLFGGSTIATQRGRGLYTAILTRRIQASLQRGVRYLTVETGPMSQPIVAKYGFWQLSAAQDFTAKNQTF
jgi:hypothetical protein